MQTQNAIKMLASFNRGIFIPLVGVNEQPAVVHSYLKDKGARISLDHVKAMMEGREQEFRDFEVVQVIGHHGPMPTQTPMAAAPQPQASVTPNRLPGRLVNPGQQEPSLTSPAPAVGRGRGREYAPSGQIKPLKRNTVYAKLMEMLVQGATMKELLSATANTTAGGVNDVLSWQIKQRGYGLRFDQSTGKYHLVFPDGHSTLKYQD
jgi:hypothetical protein